jgi:cobalamin biosynthesis protein CobW
MTQSNAKIPVTIVTGFLGSGKTTLLRHILGNAEGRRIAVIVNEFGELGIDGEILRGCGIGCEDENSEGNDREVALYELANGCVCCTVQEEFLPVMLQLAERRGDIDAVIIETSGLALPKPLVQAFQWPDIANIFTVDSVVTVVDGRPPPRASSPRTPSKLMHSAAPTPTWTTNRRCTNSSKTSCRPPTSWCSTRPT